MFRNDFSYTWKYRVLLSLLPRNMFCYARRVCVGVFLWGLAGASFFVKASEPIKVTIVADDSYPPYSYIESGELKGIYVDILKAAAQRLAKDYQIELVAMPWKRGLLSLEKSEHFAIIPPYKHKTKRPYIWPYSQALLSETVVVFCHKDIALLDAITSQSNKHTLQIGVNAGFLILNDELKDARAKGKLRIWENKDTSANIMKLIYKRIDCYVNDRMSTLWQLTQLQKHNIDLSFQDIQEKYVVMEQTAHIGYVKEAENAYPYKADFIEKMDEALVQVRNSGILDSIVDKYLSN